MLEKTRGFLGARVDLADGIRNGVEPPEQLEPGILLRGRVHHLFGDAGSGKSWLALWLAREAIRRGEVVAYLDMENGYSTVCERLQELGCEPHEVLEMCYSPSPPHDSTQASVEAYVEDLEELQPDLIIFDSWLKFLSACEMEENSNDDVAKWATKYLYSARERGITAVILDHVPHDGKRSRGAKRKKDEVDVQWAVNNTKTFNREKVGKIELKLEKDREATLLEKVVFNAGGTPEGFIFERTDSTATKNTTATNLKGKYKVGLDFLISCGENGCTWNEFVKEVGSKGSASRVKTELVELDYMEQKEDGRWYYMELKNTIDTEDIDRFQRFHNGSTELNGTGTP